MNRYLIWWGIMLWSAQKPAILYLGFYAWFKLKLVENAGQLTDVHCNPKSLTNFSLLHVSDLIIYPSLFILTLSYTGGSWPRLLLAHSCSQALP